MSKDYPPRRNDYFDHLFLINMQNQERQEIQKSSDSPDSPDSPELSKMPELEDIDQKLLVQNSSISNSSVNVGLEAEAESKILALCPITDEEIDSRDRSSTITIITNSILMTDDERKILQDRKFSLPSDKDVNIHHIASFDLDAAYEWFIKIKGLHPISRRSLEKVELERIRFRYHNQHVMRTIPEKKYIVKLFSTYIKNLISKTIDINSNDVMLLRCHLEPTDLPNYFDVSRSQAVSMLKSGFKTSSETSSETSSGASPGWIARPSQFKGYEFARRTKRTGDDFYPTAEYTAITLFDRKKNEAISHLIEKVFSKGYYIVTGEYALGVDRDNNTIQSFNNKRKDHFVCFFDVLHALLNAHINNSGIELNCF